MGRIHKLLITSCLKGIAIGWAILAIMLWLDFGKLRTVVFSSSSGVLATFLLMVGFAITFGNAAMGHAVMTKIKSSQPSPAPDTPDTPTE